MSRFISRLSGTRAVGVAAVTVLTIVLVAGVIVTTTSVGCGAANRFSLSLPRCSAVNTALHLPTSPTPHMPSPVVSLQPIPPASTPATAFPPNTNPGSAFPPNSNAGSEAYPPQDPFVGTPSAGVPPALSLTCQLPIYAGPPGSGGFVSFPSGNFTPDPRSAVAIPSPSPGASPTPVQQGPGPGYASYGMVYDQAHSRWLPVGQQLLAPDGLHYAYGDSNSIYLVNAATNTEVELASGHPWVVLRVLNDRLFATIPNAPGLWVLPFSGAAKQVTAVGYWQVASSTAAFGTETSAVPTGAQQTLVKLDVASGATSSWFSAPGASSNVIGLDTHGNPIVQGYFSSGGWVVWLTTGPTSSIVIANSGEFINLQGTAFADTHGIWFQASGQYSGAQGLVLYVQGSGLYWMTGISGIPAGPCLG